MSKQFIIYEKLLSKPRLGRYLIATKGNQNKSVRLYKYNLQLSASLFGVISMLEIALRNAIDQHYQNQLQNRDWLQEAIQSNGLFYHKSLCNRNGRFEQAQKVKDALNSLGSNYTHDKLVAELSFGFWRYMFAGIQFSVFGNTLLQILKKRPKGTNQKLIYSKLTQINNIRNRIAHHEPICFDNQNNSSTLYATNHFQDVLDLLEWLGYIPNQILSNLESPNKAIKKIEKL